MHKLTCKSGIRRNIIMVIHLHLHVACTYVRMHIIYVRIIHIAFIYCKNEIATKGLYFCNVVLTIFNFNCYNNNNTTDKSGKECDRVHDELNQISG